LNGIQVNLAIYIFLIKISLFPLLHTGALKIKVRKDKEKEKEKEKGKM
jgi:hypothetical protein